MFYYTIQPGDTLYNISVQHGVPLEAILAVNPGLSPTNLVIGQSILIPEIPHGAHGGQTQVHYHVHNHIHYPMTGLPGTRGMPGTQVMPGMPGATGTQMLPGIPGTHVMPSLPGAGMSGAEGLQGIPGTSTLPAIPGMPGTMGMPGGRSTGSSR